MWTRKMMWAVSGTVLSCVSYAIYDVYDFLYTDIEKEIKQYENRLRLYSHPDKVFRYFATLQDSKTGVIYMNPEDLLCALTPNTIQPMGLGLDQFKKFDRNATSYESTCFASESIFHSLGVGGLISFSDFIFLLAVYGTSAHHTEITFKMFDINGDGEVSMDEFEKVSSLFLNLSSAERHHHDCKTTGNVKKDNTGLQTYFFGEDGTGVLTFEEFLKFKQKLQEEVVYLEFNSFVPKDETITERQFAEALLVYFNIQNAKWDVILTRIYKVYGDKAKGVEFDDYLAFFKCLMNMRDIEAALRFHTITGLAIDKATFKQVAKTGAGVDLSDHIIDIVFCIFDENADDFVAVAKESNYGSTEEKKFVAVLKELSSSEENQLDTEGGEEPRRKVILATDLFLTHNWGKDQKGRNNHHRAQIVNNELQKRGFECWFDSERMVGNVHDRMIEGIDNTRCVLVFITEKYMMKVNGDKETPGDQEGDEMDNCRFEYRYAVRHKKPNGMICVVMDNTMKKTGNWRGFLDATMGGELFVDMTGDLDDEEYLSKEMAVLIQQLELKGIKPSFKYSK